MSKTEDEFSKALEYIKHEKYVESAQILVNQINDMTNKFVPLIPELAKITPGGREKRDLSIHLLNMSQGPLRVFEAIIVECTELFINCQILDKIPSDPDNTIDKKKSWAKYISRSLTRIRASIVHPKTGRHCNLYANQSPDKKGRYLLEDKETKKRSMSSTSLLKLVPLKLETTSRMFKIREDGTIVTMIDSFPLAGVSPWSEPYEEKPTRKNKSK